MEKVVSKIAGLGVPGLVLLVAIGATGLSGGAAIVAALAALGPGGILGGIATLGVIGMITLAISEYGFDQIFIAVIKELLKQGHTVADIKYKINNDKMYKLVSKSLKLKLIGYLDQYNQTQTV